MKQHLFIFSSGKWLGEGMINFSYSPEQLKFYTHWEIDPISSEDGGIRCLQTVQIVGFDEKTKNKFIVFPLEDKKFHVLWKNEFIDIEGLGFWDAQNIFWEFTDNPEYAGSERFWLQDNGYYHFHAEYGSKDYRTLASGRIWKSSK